MVNQDDSGYTNNHTQITFWIESPFVDNGSPITGYQVSANNGGWEDLTYSSADPHEASMPYSSGIPGGGCTISHYRLRAVNAVGESDPSNTVDLLDWGSCLP